MKVPQVGATLRAAASVSAHHRARVFKGECIGVADAHAALNVADAEMKVLGYGCLVDERLDVLRRREVIEHEAGVETGTEC